MKTLKKEFPFKLRRWKGRLLLKKPANKNRENRAQLMTEINTLLLEA